MTSSFPALRRALALFADLDWPVADRLLQRMADEPGKAAAMRRELDLAIGDPATNWPDLVSNDSYELTDADDPGAKDLVLDFLWDALHPSEPPRKLDPSSFRAYLHVAPPNSGSLSYDFTAGAETDVHIEDTSRDQDVARVTHIKRVGNVLQVAYEPAQAHPLPSTLRKLLRSTLRDLLEGTFALSGATEIELEDTRNRIKVRVAL